MAHDLQLPPDCANALGHINPAAPSYCNSSWCYVNPAICDKIDVRQSVYFGLETDLWFSYAACGSVNTFSDSTQYLQAAACAARTQEGCIGPCEWVTSKCRDTYRAANPERDLYMNILDPPVPRQSINWNAFVCAHASIRMCAHACVSAQFCSCNHATIMHTYTCSD